MWFLWWGTTPKGIEVPQKYKDTFNALARKAVAKLPDSHAAGGKEPWQLWLDFMRRSGWGFRVTSQVACTEREWDLGVKDGKPLIKVRQEQGYTEGDEWTKVYRRTKSGKLRRLSARELKHKSSEDLQKYYHWLESGSIEHVFESSAYFCEELASRAFESETAERHSSELPAGGVLPKTKARQMRFTNEKTDKGKLDLLHGPDGKLKTFVNLDVARRYGGVSKRAIEKAISKGALESQGQRTNRRVQVSSLLKYFPPET